MVVLVTEGALRRIPDSEMGMLRETAAEVDGKLAELGRDAVRLGQRFAEIDAAFMAMSDQVGDWLALIAGEPEGDEAQLAWVARLDEVRSTLSERVAFAAVEALQGDVRAARRRLSVVETVPAAPEIEE